MQHIQASLLVLALLACGQAVALPADHPANPEAAMPAFRPADYFAGQSGSVKLAAPEHQHDAAPESGAADESAAHETSEDKGCKRDEGMGCCCKCCCMGDDGMKCMKKSGDAGKKWSGMHGCDMMKKGMQQDGGKPDGEPAAKKDEGHESHH